MSPDSEADPADDAAAKAAAAPTTAPDGTAPDGTAPDGTAPDGTGGDAPAAAAEPTEFILDITFSGLCLLVRQTKGRHRLLVLLPRVPGEGGEMPEHLMVLGTHRRFAHSGPFERKGEFREYVLKDGDLTFSNWGSDKPATLALPKEVVDLTGAADEQAPIPAQARLRWAIGSGKFCTECSNDDGGVWRFEGRKQRMSTRLAWRICGVTATVGDRPGIAIKFTAAEGGEQNFFIQAVPEPDPHSTRKRLRAALYLYHTPADELPSHAGHPLQQAEEDGDENHHFAAYYGLFVPNLDVPLPVRVPDAEEDEDEDEDEDGEDEGEENGEEEEDKDDVQEGAEGNENLLLEGQARMEFLRSATSAYHGFHGRLFTCTLATSTDRHTPQPLVTATTPEG